MGLSDEEQQILYNKASDVELAKLEVEYWDRQMYGGEMPDQNSLPEVVMGLAKAKEKLSLLEEELDCMLPSLS